MSQETVQIECSKSIWYEDGDIILSVKEDKTESKMEHQYRVHRLILCLASPVFRDMSEIPQPADNKSRSECPVIPLGDSPEELSALLRALYKGLYVAVSTLINQGLPLKNPTSAVLDDDQWTFDDALRILLLSNKYIMEDLRRGIIRVMLEQWPLHRSNYLDRQKLFASSECRVIQSMRLIKAAQHCEVSELLPTAFYELANSNIRDWSDVEISTSHHLTAADVSRLLVGRDRSAHRLQKLVTWNNDMPTMWCPDIDVAPVTIFSSRSSMGACTAPASLRTWSGGTYHCSSIFTLLRKKIGDQFFDGKPAFRLFREIQHSDFYGNGPCRICTDWIMLVLANKEQEMWENIAVDFDLPKIDPKRYSESMFKPF